jgi:LSD1 subclass zinc finger protein
MDTMVMKFDDDDDSDDERFASKMPAQAKYPPAAAKPPSRREMLARQPSWVQDALQQPGMTAADIASMIGVSTEEVESWETVEDEEELLEEEEMESQPVEEEAPPEPEVLDIDHEVISQYSVTAKMQAHQLFEEKFGSEVCAYIESMQGGKRSAEPPNLLLEIAWPKPLVPSFHIPAWDAKKEFNPSREWAVSIPELPPLLDWEAAVADERKRPEELQTGEIANRGSVMKRGSVTNVRCSECKNQLQVAPIASLVHCAKCSSVTPNNSTIQ